MRFDVRARAVQTLVDKRAAGVPELLRKLLDDPALRRSALRGLASLGFIEFLDSDGIRLRPPLLRFADPVRTLEDPATALARLISEAKVVTQKLDDDGEEEP